MPKFFIQPNEHSLSNIEVQYNDSMDNYQIDGYQVQPKKIQRQDSLALDEPPKNPKKSMKKQGASANLIAPAPENAEPKKKKKKAAPQLEPSAPEVDITQRKKKVKKVKTTESLDQARLEEPKRSKSNTTKAEIQVMNLTNEIEPQPKKKKVKKQPEPENLTKSQKMLEPQIELEPEIEPPKKKIKKVKKEPEPVQIPEPEEPKKKVKKVKAKKEEPKTEDKTNDLTTSALKPQRQSTPGPGRRSVSVAIVNEPEVEISMIAKEVEEAKKKKKKVKKSTKEIEKIEVPLHQIQQMSSMIPFQRPRSPSIFQTDYTKQIYEEQNKSAQDAQIAALQNQLNQVLAATTQNQSKEQQQAQQLQQMEANMKQMKAQLELEKQKTQFIEKQQQNSQILQQSQTSHISNKDDDVIKQKSETNQLFDMLMKQIQYHVEQPATKSQKALPSYQENFSENSDEKKPIVIAEQSVGGGLAQTQKQKSDNKIEFKDVSLYSSEQSPMKPRRPHSNQQNASQSIRTDQSSKSQLNQTIDVNLISASAVKKVALPVKVQQEKLKKEVDEMKASREAEEENQQKQKLIEKLRKLIHQREKETGEQQSEYLNLEVLPENQLESFIEQIEEANRMKIIEAEKINIDKSVGDLKAMMFEMHRQQQEEARIQMECMQKMIQVSQEGMKEQFKEMISSTMELTKSQINAQQQAQMQQVRSMQAIPQYSQQIPFDVTNMISLMARQAQPLKRPSLQETLRFLFADMGK
ncbi:Hypothetical_protein [Hexamita inflata]|uniref:Hypothetical_protein n=1 Tax=Hexamita inflata TaxID=28002 RepID=A0AA86Q3K5_9EUKA|nr:Hypothetical protein HINF_LOCUS39185 [Hexamita inflata]